MSDQMHPGDDPATTDAGRPGTDDTDPYGIPLGAPTDGDARVFTAGGGDWDGIRVALVLVQHREQGDRLAEFEQRTAFLLALAAEPFGIVTDIRPPDFGFARFEAIEQKRLVADRT